VNAPAKIILYDSFVAAETNPPIEENHINCQLFIPNCKGRIARFIKSIAAA